MDCRVCASERRGIRKDNVLNKDQCEEVVSFRLGTPAGQEEQLQANTEFI